MVKLVIILGLLNQILCVFGQPKVEVEQGEIQGKTVPFHDEYLGIHTDIDVYLGIPYAEPPIGQGRFSPPLPKEPWGDDEVYNATYNRDICMQESLDDSFNISEDCLHLNVYAPSPTPTDAAVMVFIHGGGYIEGNGYAGYYGGLPLSGIGEIILVTINYRLTALGFLTTGDEALPGNYGMLDQVEALKWVKTNIQAFGGDENKITIFGESAGGSSVSSHFYSPLSRDAFDQAILQSGSTLAGWAFHDEKYQREKAFKLGEAVGCSTSSSQELLSCMREVDAQAISKAAFEIQYLSAPCVDNNFLIEPPMASLEKNNFKKCPLINGFNKDEGTLFIVSSEEFGFPYLNSSEAPYVSKEAFDRELRKMWEYNTGFYTNDVIEDSVKQEYVDWSKSDDPDADYFDSWNNVATDQSFACPATLETRYHAMAGEYDVYQYFFTHVPSISIYTSEYGEPGWLGASHAEDLPFVFGYPFEPSTYLDFHEYLEEEKELSHRMIKYWTNFAKTGNPGKESDSSIPYDDERAWPAFTIPELQYKELAVTLTEGSGLKADECHFWNEYLMQLTTFSADLAETERQWREEFYSWKYTDMEDWRDAFEKYQEVVNNP